MIKAKRHPRQFSKVILALYAVFVIIWVSASYVLAVLGFNVNESVTVAVIGSLGVAMIGYYSKSFAEKNSLNKYHISLEEEKNDQTIT